MTVTETSATDTTVTAAPLPVLDGSGRAALFHDARSANAFTDEPVSDETLREIWSLAKWPPTLANMQPLRVLFVRPGAGRDRLAPLLSEGNRDKTAAAPAVAVLAYDTDFHTHVPTIFPSRPQMQDHFGSNDTMRHAVASNNGWLQAGYFILAVRAAGLAAGPMAGFDADGVDREFFAGTSLRSFLVVNIGHPAAGAWLDRLPRLDDEVAVSFV